MIIFGISRGIAQGRLTALISMQSAIDSSAMRFLVFPVATGGALGHSSVSTPDWPTSTAGFALFSDWQSSFGSGRHGF
jgi:hypothetical protein